MTKKVTKKLSSHHQAVRLSARNLACLASILFLAGCGYSPSPLVPSFRGSVGKPNAGVLMDGVELPKHGKGYKWYNSKGNHFGTPQLVKMIEEVAKNTSIANGQAPLLVGDLSAEHGGKIRGHNSHRSGRDVDLLYYFTTPAGAPISAPGFVKVGPDGLAAVSFGDRPFVRFDVVRSWRLIKSLLQSKQAHVLWIFVSKPVEGLLIQYARSLDEDPALLWHAENVLHQPGDSMPHDDHFHVRIACSPEEQVHGCSDEGGPKWPWLPSLPRVKEDRKAWAWSADDDKQDLPELLAARRYALLA
jgi:penicillin-insensitive murein DD-endopeptidase